MAFYFLYILLPGVATISIHNEGNMPEQINHCKHLLILVLSEFYFYLSMYEVGSLPGHSSTLEYSNSEPLKKAVLVFFANPGHGLISSAIKKKYFIDTLYSEPLANVIFFNDTRSPAGTQEAGVQARTGRR